MYIHIPVNQLHEAYEQAMLAMYYEGEFYTGENQTNEEMMRHIQAHIDILDMENLTLTHACIQSPEEVNDYALEFLYGSPHEDGLSYTYHGLYSQYYEQAIAELKRNGHSRRAVLPLAGEKSYGLYPPCLQIMLMKINKGKLNFTALFRSNDLIQAFPQNSFAIGRLMHKMAGELGVKVGTLSYIADDLHVYNNCLPKYLAYVTRIENGDIGHYEWRDGSWVGWDE